MMVKEQQCVQYRKNNFLKSCFQLIIITVSFSIYAKETVIINQSFENEKQLKNWRMSQKPIFDDPKYKEKFSIKTEGDKKFLHTSGAWGYFGTALKPAVKIDNSVEKIEVIVEMRNAKGPNIMSFAVSNEPHYFTNPFRKGGRGSGFYIKGYQYGNNSNLIKFRKEGEEVICRASVAPFNFLASSKNHKWVRWKLTYDHAKKQLEFTRDGENEPSLIQREVDLTGVSLRRIFLKMVVMTIVMSN